MNVYPPPPSSIAISASGMARYTAAFVAELGPLRYSTYASAKARNARASRVIRMGCRRRPRTEKIRFGIGRHEAEPRRDIPIRRMRVLVAAGVGRYMLLEAYVRTYPH